jgi:hypothetical protein
MKKDIKLSSIRVTGILLGPLIQILFIKYIGSSEYGVYGLINIILVLKRSFIAYNIKRLR